MPEQVVVGLEQVHVDQQQGSQWRALRPTPRCHCSSKPLIEPSSVRQPRQTVRVRQLPIPRSRSSAAKSSSALRSSSSAATGNAVNNATARKICTTTIRCSMCESTISISGPWPCHRQADRNHRDHKNCEHRPGNPNRKTTSSSAGKMKKINGSLSSVNTSSVAIAGTVRQEQGVREAASLADTCEETRP